MSCNCSYFRDGNKTLRLVINLFVQVLLLSSNIRITYVLTIFREIVKIVVLIHHNKTHVKKCVFQTYKASRVKMWTIKKKHTLKRKGHQCDSPGIHSLNFTENAEDTQRLLWIPGYLASREMLDRRWANVVTYVGAMSANDVGPMWICPSVQRWHNVVTPPTMTLCQRFANVITYCILLYLMVGTTFAHCLYEWLAKPWHNFIIAHCKVIINWHLGLGKPRCQLIIALQAIIL